MTTPNCALEVVERRVWVGDMDDTLYFSLFVWILEPFPGSHRDIQVTGTGQFHLE
jgi:hypothetical protein